MSLTLFSYLFGGLGLFLIGMTALTEGLRDAAGPSLRQLLARFARTPFSAALTGVAFTAAVQSSSAATLTAIGFLNAGLLELAQAIAIIFGANLGTTLTAWLVSLLGFKVDVAAIALPAIGVGAALRLFGRNRAVTLGWAMAGFGMLFTGLDLMQQALGGAGAPALPDSLSAATVGGRLALVGVGTILTVVMQSSSASLAVTLTALATNAIGVPEAAALAIGHNIGTTSTAILAGLKATSPARRAALAHVLFNVVAAGVALATFPWFLAATTAVAESFSVHDGPLVLAFFHTAFNLVGFVLLIPFTGRLATLLTRLFHRQEEDWGRPRFLDGNALTIPEAAADAVDRELSRLEMLIAGALGFKAARALRAPREKEALAAHASVKAAAGQLIGAIAAYMEKVPRTEGVTARLQRSFRVLEHLEDAAAVGWEAGAHVPGLRHVIGEAAHACTVMEELVEEAVAVLGAEGDVDFRARALMLQQISERVSLAREEGRHAIFSAVAQGRLSSSLALSAAEYVNLLARVVHHLFRETHYRSEGAPMPTPHPSDEPAPRVPPESSEADTDEQTPVASG